MAVFVVGALHLDVIVDAPRLPRIDETLVGQSVRYAFGGKGGNQAVAAARMGATVAMAGRVGPDGFGDQLLGELDRAGVDRTQVRRDPGASGMSVAIVQEDGDYGAVIVSAANLAIDPDEVSIPDDARLVLLQNEVPDTVNRAVAEGAATRGIPVLWNAAPHRHASEIDPTHIAHLVVNRVEAADMSGEDTPQAAADALLAQGFKSVILTLGADGLIQADATGQHPMPGLDVPVISTHGAGDAFVGALAARLDTGDSMRAALAFAQAAATLHVSTPVDQRPEITPEKVHAFLSAQTGNR